VHRPTEARRGWCAGRLARHHSSDRTATSPLHAAGIDAENPAAQRRPRAHPHTSGRPAPIGRPAGSESPIAACAARHAGYRRGVLTWLLWLTGEYGRFGGKVIPVNEPESWHTLDALVHLDTPIVQRTTDTHGTTELTFAIADLLGWEFYPRLAYLTDRRLYLLGRPDPLTAAEQLLTHRIHDDLILEQWDELLRIVGSIKRGWIIPSVLISRTATDPKPDRTARALREYGRLRGSRAAPPPARSPPARRQRDPLLEHPLHRAQPRAPRTARDRPARRADRRRPQRPHEHINLVGHHDINLRAGPRHGNHRPLRLPAELDTLLKRAATNKTATNA
jgi:Tn3 transposase DDE domain